ncbi:MAG: LVIVD repeat-containing protein [Burkholderiales bacterium]
MSKSKGIKEVSYVDIGHGGGGHAAVGGTREIAPVSWLDCAGGGQVVVERGIAYVGNMRNPHGTMIIDVKDPKHPKPLAEITMPPGTHSHKVRAQDGIMVTNREILGERGLKGEVPPEDFRGGLGIYDVSNPAKPRLITNWNTTEAPGGSGARGVHRFDFDGRYAYISPTCEGYIGNIMMILDLRDPARPQEVGRWWMPGQWTAGGETPTWKGTAHRCHHPLRYGNRLYTSYWHGGFVILDIDDMAKPKFVSGLDWSPPFPWPTHTCLRIPFKIDNRDFAVVSDEDVVRLEGCPPYPSAFLWIVDITDEKHPTPVSTFQLDDIPPEEQPYMTGCHQPSEKVVMGTEIPVAWFAHGLRIVDIARPHAPKEVAYFMPDVPPGSARVQSNDVTVDERGLIYLLDRVRGLHILERVG